MRPVTEADPSDVERPRNAARLVEVVGELDQVADVASGKPISDETPNWLRRRAAALDRWLLLFAEELETVRRARNNVLWKMPISNGNVAAAVLIAERLLQIAKSTRSLTA